MKTEHRFTPIKWLGKTINRALYFENTRSLLMGVGIGTAPMSYYIVVEGGLSDTVPNVTSDVYRTPAQ